MWIEYKTESDYVNPVRLSLAPASPLQEIAWGRPLAPP
jgi:hypothetical protein